MPLSLAILHLTLPAQVEALELRGTFTTATDQTGPRGWRLEQVALLVGREGVEEFGLVTRTLTPIATAQHRLRYTRQVVFDAPLGVDELCEALPSSVRAAFRDRVDSSPGGVLPAVTGQRVVEAIGNLRPAMAPALETLLRQAPRRRTAPLPYDSMQVAAHEGDALRLALDIADIPRRVLSEVRPDGEKSFVERLAEIRTAEDPAISFDSMRFLDFRMIDSPAGVVRFASGYERLTVINVNRQPLERTTGADLIYVNETQDSFVLVQYKSFRREGRAPSRLVYRPDGQLEAELDRMRGIDIAPADGTPAQYRLHPGCCFLKLCKPVSRIDHPVRELVSGMYLPLDYYDALADSNEVRGPRGGLAFSYDNVSRHIANDLFVSLVRGGWVGSRGATSRLLTEVVLAGLDADRSMTVAASATENDYVQT